MLKLASKPLISKPKKNVQAAKKTPKGGKPAAPLQKALKAQKKVLETEILLKIIYLAIVYISSKASFPMMILSVGISLNFHEITFLTQY